MFNTASDLKTAIAAAKGGEVFELGDITEPVRISGRDFAENITLKGGSISLQPSAGLVDFQPLLWIDGSAGIMIDGVRLTGVGSGGEQKGWGLRCSGSKRVSMMNCSLSGLKIAAMLNDVSAISIAHNDIALCREGVDIVMAEDVQVWRNWMRDFDCGDGDHVDAVQFWTRQAARGCARVTISENLMHFARATPGQGVNGGDGELGYDGFVIEDNIIINPMWNAIVFDNCATNLRVAGNRVYNTPGGPEVPGGPIVPWIRVPASADTRSNIAPRFIVIDGAGASSVTTPAGNNVVADISTAGADAIAAEWLAKMRPQTTPAPEPGPLPTPTPTPVPAPDPAPPIDTATLRAKLTKAAAEVNTAVNDLRRAKTAVDAAGKALDALEVAIAGR